MTNSWASSEGVRRSMKANRSRDTGPELRLRSELHRRGLRYFVDRAPIKGVRRRADVVFPRRKIAVFVDGCFWHGCPEHHTLSKTNAEYWKQKVERNRSRDRDTDRLLSDAGWIVIRSWEHDDVIAVADRIEKAVGSSKVL
ncbi:very short patch repair endonuclease [Gordonia iterans]